MGVSTGNTGQIDKDFFVALLDHLRSEISIDPARIYATGLSDGGTLANTLACEMSATFAAIAPVSGIHADINTCVIEKPLSVLVIHGTGDEINPYDGNGSDVPPVQLWVEAWVHEIVVSSHLKSTSP